MRQRSMNWELIASNLEEARNDLRDILHELGHPEMSARNLKIRVEHVLSHILYAWNLRQATWEQVERMDEDGWVRCHQLNDLVLRPRHRPEEPAARSGKFQRQLQRGRQIVQRHWTKAEEDAFTWHRRRRKARDGD